MPGPARDESRLLRSGRFLAKDLLTATRVFRELMVGTRRLRALGPSVIVTGAGPSRWTRATAACDDIGSWLASQGFAALTLGEAGLSERLVRSCERVGGRVSRCPLAKGAAFKFELSRRFALVNSACATIALAPTGEALGMIHFLLALSRFKRLPDHRLFILHPAQWPSHPWEGEPLHTVAIEGSAELHFSKI